MYYTRVSSSMMEAAKEVLPAKTRAQPSWFVSAAEKLAKLIEEAVNDAKNAWIKDKWDKLNNGHLQKGTANCWQALGEIKKGL